MKRKINFFPIFLFFVVINSLYIDFTTTNYNTTSRVLPIVSILEQGKYNIDEYIEFTRDKSYVNGHYYTDKAPLPTLFVLPFAYLASKVGILNSESGTIRGPKLYGLSGWLVGSLPLALIMTLFVLDITNNTSAGLRKAIAIGALPILGSYLFVFSGTFFGHIFAGMFLFLSYRSIKIKNYLIAGLFAGFAINSEYPLLLIVALWGLLLLFQKKYKAVLYSAAGMAIPILFMLTYNFILTGSPIDFLYNHIPSDYAKNDGAYGFNYPKIEAILGLLVSPSHGLLVYAPFLTILLWGGINKNIISVFKKRYFLIIPVLSYILLISSHEIWWGGWSFGPRHLIAITILLLYETSLWLSKISPPKKWLIASLSFGLCYALLAKATVSYSVPSYIKFPLTELILKNIKTGQWNSSTIFTEFLHLNPFAGNLLCIGTIIFLVMVILVINHHKKFNLKSFI